MHNFRRKRTHLRSALVAGAFGGMLFAAGVLALGYYEETVQSYGTQVGRIFLA